MGDVPESHPRPRGSAGASPAARPPEEGEVAELLAAWCHRASGRAEFARREVLTTSRCEASRLAGAVVARTVALAQGQEDRFRFSYVPPNFAGPGVGAGASYGCPALVAPIGRLRRCPGDTGTENRAGRRGRGGVGSCTPWPRRSGDRGGALPRGLRCRPRSTARTFPSVFAAPQPQAEVPPVPDSAP